MIGSSSHSNQATGLRLAPRASDSKCNAFPGMHQAAAQRSPLQSPSLCDWRGNHEPLKRNLLSNSNVFPMRQQPFENSLLGGSFSLISTTFSQLIKLNYLLISLRDSRTLLCMVLKKLISKTPDRQQMIIFNSSCGSKKNYFQEENNE